MNTTRWINPGRVRAFVSFTLVQFCPRFTQFFSRFSPYFFLRLPSCLPNIVFPIEKANIFLEWKLFLINRKWILMIIRPKFTPSILYFTNALDNQDVVLLKTEEGPLDWFFKIFLANNQCFCLFFCLLYFLKRKKHNVSSRNLTCRLTISFKRLW